MWTPAQRAAWQWPDPILPSEWAQKHRRLPGHVTAEPGPWRNERTPYLVGIMDAICEPGVEEVVVPKAAQVGFSEALRNILGYWIDHDPGPCLVVMPDKKSAGELVDERFKPLIEFTPAIARHLTSRLWDVKKSAIKLDTMSIYLGSSYSSQALKSRPIRYLLLEEPDEYPQFSGSGGDPISKAKKRITTYSAKGRARVIIGGTPTTRLGNIWRAWELCDVKRYLWVPCPHCGKYQRLLWTNVKWPDLKADEPERARRAARIENDSLAYYECEHCHGQIIESHKAAMINRGVWANEDQAVTPDGRRVGPPERRAKRIGMQLPATYSPWVTWSQLAAEFIAAQGDPQALMDFVNQRLAEPFEEQRAKTAPEFIERKAKGGADPLIVPDWADLLIATADTQGVDERSGFFWYTVRAWAGEYRSQLIDYGIAATQDELVERTINRTFESESGEAKSPKVLVVDSGGPRWNEIYQFSLSDKRIHPAKGAAASRTWMVTPREQKKHKVVLWEIDTEQSKDLLHRLIHSPDLSQWLPHNQVGSDYCRQLCAETKIYNPREGREEWVETIQNMNHLWDCEAMQCAAAWRLNCGAVRREEKRSWFAARKKR